MPMGEGPPRTTIPYIDRGATVPGEGIPYLDLTPDSFLHWTKPFRSVARGRGRSFPTLYPFIPNHPFSSAPSLLSRPNPSFRSFLPVPGYYYNTPNENEANNYNKRSGKSQF